MLAEKEIPIHRRLGRFALEIFAPMNTHLEPPQVSMPSGIEQPLEPRTQQTSMEETKSLTKFTLFKSLISPSTFPHLLMLVLVCVLFFTVAQLNQEQLATYGFVGFSLAYACLAPLARSDRFAAILRYEKDPNSTLTQSLPARFKILIAPLTLATVLLFVIGNIFGENGILHQVGTFLPSVLGGMFVLWAIAQGRFFGVASMNAIRVPQDNESKESTRPSAPSLIMTSMLVVVMTFFVTEGLRFFVTGSSFSLWPYVFSFGVYGICVYYTWSQRQRASKSGATHAVAKKWFWATQLFITWHVLSIYRSVDSASDDALIFIEELILMIVTVFLAIWALTSKGEGSTSELFTPENALFWGVSFGYAYAGSVAMLTSVMDEIRLVLIAGHILVVITVMHSQKSMLETKIQRIDSDRNIVHSIEKLEVNKDPVLEKAVEQTTQEDQPEPSTPPESEPIEDESIGDPVDWNQVPETLGDDTDWDDEVELLD